MIERIQGLPAGVEGLRAKGQVTKDDYVTILQPILDEARSQGRRIRLLYHLGPDFEGFTAGAAWEDGRIGLQYLRLFERCAVVSDIGWIRESMRLAGALMPCPVKVFSNAEWQDSLAWLSAPIADTSVAHRLLPESGVLVVDIERPLRREDFDALAMTVDPWIETHGNLQGVVIHAREFPGWQNPGSFIRHLSFVRDHQREVHRVALCVDGRVAEVVPSLAEHFVAAEIKHFGYDQLDEAIAWARAAAT